MKICIIAAMKKEVDLLLLQMKDYAERKVSDFTVYEGRIGDKDVTVAQCGIGKVNAALRTMAVISACRPDLIINSGVAGGIDASMHIADVLVADRVAYHDVWCGPGTEWGEAAGCPPYFEADQAVAALSCFDRREIKRGLIASGDIFVSRVEEVERIKALYPDVMAVDMESGAIAQTCHMKGVRFFCFRVISDTPGAYDNISQYCNFWTDAPTHTFELLTTIIDRLKD